jgi:hypothetical protein
MVFLVLPLGPGSIGAGRGGALDVHHPRRTVRTFRSLSSTVSWETS